MENFKSNASIESKIQDHFAKISVENGKLGQDLQKLITASLEQEQNNSQLMLENELLKEQLHHLKQELSTANMYIKGVLELAKTLAQKSNRATSSHENGQHTLYKSVHDWLTNNEGASIVSDYHEYNSDSTSGSLQRNTLFCKPHFLCDEN